MTVYRPGQRIYLVRTDDPYTELRPGDLGTVQRHDPVTSRVDIAWDNGSSLSMLLDRGDRITPAGDADGTHPVAASTVAADGEAPTPRRRAAPLAAATASGTAAGRSAADWWGQHAVGGRASGDVRAAARRILAGIDDGDPAVLNTLPLCDRSGGSITAPEALDEFGTPPPLTAEEQAEALSAYADAYDEAAEARVVELCHLAASPTGTDVSHLHPDRMGVGAVGVFSGEWACTVGDDGGDRILVGFVGTLVDRWNGWAVFTCTRQVAEAIVTDHEQQRCAHRDALRDGGVPETELEGRVDSAFARLAFDGDVLVADQRAQQDDPDAIERVPPDGDGRYIVMGRTWCWEPVDPYLCDRIVGDIPAPGRA
jgi:hypothetical protein